jgi:hypothetical protein
MLTCCRAVPLVALTLFCCVIAPAGASAAVIRYEALDLADAVPGQDSWQYRYEVSGFSEGAGSGFSILFDEALFSQLEVLPLPVSSDWDVIALQPDLNLPDQGRYDALALTDAPSIADPFVVNFIWIGQGAPGSQPFELYDPAFQTIAVGETILKEAHPGDPAPIPEPDAVLLMGISLLGLRAWLRRSLTV